MWVHLGPRKPPATCFSTWNRLPALKRAAAQRQQVRTRRLSIEHPGNSWKAFRMLRFSSQEEDRQPSHVRRPSSSATLWLLFRSGFGVEKRGCFRERQNRTFLFRRRNERSHGNLKQHS